MIRVTPAEPGAQYPPRQALHSQEQSNLLFSPTGVTLSQDNGIQWMVRTSPVVANPAALLTVQWESGYLVSPLAHTSPHAIGQIQAMRSGIYYCLSSVCVGWGGWVGI